ncbi:hypothetical protein WJX84_001651 [Apatococcus fuscideae]|uniref:Uncharacterized protein n=1 Tax=Apatococcus fuscideae TaxID=2026836 RepID=A0AAW1SYT4_9CHLO
MSGTLGISLRATEHQRGSWAQIFISSHLLRQNPLVGTGPQPPGQLGERHQQRILQQSESSCPPADQAAAACGALSQNQQNMIHHILLTSCSSIVPGSGMSSGAGACCAALSSMGASCYTNFQDCAWV